MASRKKIRRSTKQKRGGISTTHILIVAGVAVLVVGLLVVLNANRSQTTATDQVYETGVTPDGEPYKGSPDAPLQLVEYSDFLCGHCGNFADTLDNLSPDYIETGKLQVIFRNYAFLAPESLQAAQAVECALDQGADKFWLYHDLLFANRGTGMGGESQGVEATPTWFIDGQVVRGGLPESELRQILDGLLSQVP
jgi:protein-disulfide isomerase